MDINIELVHFQITKNCNLRCEFCGQWGKHGFFNDKNGKEMEMADWENVAEQLEKINPLPNIILWGGEPLVSPDFRYIAQMLHKRGFKLGMVTNGVFIKKYADLINECFSRVYVSIDGPKELHDSVRGAGVYEKATNNLRLLNSEIITVMTVLTEKLNVREFAETLFPYKIILHEMIPFDGQEIRKYSGAVPGNVTYSPHGDDASNSQCLSPWRHIHITWNGEVMYCTDFYNYSVGNVKSEKIVDIIKNEKSEQFRKMVLDGKCENCNYCSWKNNDSFYLQ